MNKTDVVYGGVVFRAPGHGSWELETTHHGLRPLSHLVRDAYVRAFEAGTTAMLARYGLPLARVRAELVEGCFYVRPQAVGEGSKPLPALPTLLLKLVTRLHPELRRRTRVAASAWDERRWRDEVDQWFDHDRAVAVRRNLELQRVDLGPLHDAELAGHLAECLRHFEDSMRRNLDTHGGDLIPVGDLLAHGERWGVDHATMASLLVGGSPATTETAYVLRPVAIALAGAETIPRTIDDVRSLGADAAGAVDAWFEQHAWRLVTSDDVDRPSLAELPELQLQTLLGAVDPKLTPTDGEAVIARVPADQRALFVSLLDEAQYGARQRDDIRGLCWNWPGGLVRRAALEAGRRLVAAGRMRAPEHAAELAPVEIDSLLRHERGPDADVLARRAEARDAVEAMPPPRSLGEPEPPPPLDAFPAPMARATRAVMATLTAETTAPQTEALRGTGVGDHPYRGRACVVGDLGEAAGMLEPGDVLVTRFTGPSVNSLLPMLGALVVEEGGPMCHAAIVAREFGLPAVVGALGAMTIPPGSTIEVDPIAGVVRLID